VTLHRLEVEYDTGEIVERRELEIPASDDAWRLARRLDKPALELLAWAARSLDGGHALTGEKQAGEPGRWARRPTEEDLRLDWRAPREELLRLIRAAAPWPGASALLGEHGVEVLRAEAASEPPPRALRPAEAYDHRGEVAVVCGDAALVLTRVREGEVLLSRAALRARVKLA
jgi:methionyl-tRNA formyltransferase